MHKYKNLVLFLTLLSIGLVLSGCSIWRGKPAPSTLILNIAASAEVNPDLTGNPSPLVIVIYQLKSPVAYQEADFFSLYQQPLKVLGGDLLQKQQLEIRPGQNLQLNLNLVPQAQYLGVVAAYRVLQAQNWRQQITLKPGLTTWQVQAGKEQLGVNAQKASK